MMTKTVFRQAEFVGIVESPNMIHEKVPCDCIENYINLNQLKDTIIPDILIHSHFRVTNTDEPPKMEVIFDIDTLRIDKNEIFYPEIRRNLCIAIDTKVMKGDYMRRIEKLGGKGRATYTTCPFSKVLKSDFYSGDVYHI